MKRIVSIALATIMCAALFAGCGGSKEVNLSDVIASINSEYSISLKSLESADELSKYYSINTEDVKQFAAEIDSNNNAPVEIVLVEAVDANAANEIETALNNRLNSIVSQYASYTPEKVDMVKACKVTKDGNFVSMIVADNAEDMLKIYNDSIK